MSLYLGLLVLLTSLQPVTPLQSSMNSSLATPPRPLGVIGLIESIPAVGASVLRATCRRPSAIALRNLDHLIALK
jgi:hypothetical protein